MSKTRKRTKDRIIEVIEELPQGVHLSAQELHDKVVKEGEAVSLSTIYRALERLQTMGAVRSIMSSRGQLWESAHNDEQHDHLICTSCGITIEFSDDLVGGFGKTVAERKGFKYQESRFDIFGYCSNCKEQRRTFEYSAIKDILLSGSEDLGRGKATIDEWLNIIDKDGQYPSLKDLKSLKKQLADSLENIDEVIDLFE